MRRVGLHGGSGHIADLREGVFHLASAVRQEFRGVRRNVDKADARAVLRWRQHEWAERRVGPVVDRGRRSLSAPYLMERRTRDLFDLDDFRQSAGLNNDRFALLVVAGGDAVDGGKAH